MKNKTSFILLAVALLLLLIPDTKIEKGEVNELTNPSKIIYSETVTTLSLAEDNNGKRIDVPSGYLEILEIISEHNLFGVYSEIDIRFNGENDYSLLAEGAAHLSPIDPKAVYLRSGEEWIKLSEYYYREPEKPKQKIHGFLVDCKETKIETDLIELKFVY